MEEARAFLADAESRLFDLGVRASRAQWVQENFITDDTQQIAAAANEQVNTLSADLAKKAQRFDGLSSAEDARKMTLLKLAAVFQLQTIQPHKKSRNDRGFASVETTAKVSGVTERARLTAPSAWT